MIIKIIFENPHINSIFIIDQIYKFKNIMAVDYFDAKYVGLSRIDGHFIFNVIKGPSIFFNSGFSYNGHKIKKVENMSSLSDHIPGYEKIISNKEILFNHLLKIHNINISDLEDSEKFKSILRDLKIDQIL